MKLRQFQLYAIALWLGYAVGFFPSEAMAFILIYSLSVAAYTLLEFSK